MNKKLAFSVGCAPGYEEIIFWIGREKEVIAQCTILNKEFYTQAWGIFEKLLKAAEISFNHLSYLIFLSGPAPLMTLRTVCAALQAFMQAHGDLQVVVLGGMKYWLQAVHKGEEEAVLLLKAYAGKIYWYDTRVQQEIILSLKEVQEKVVLLFPKAVIYKGEGVLDDLLTCCLHTRLSFFNPLSLQEEAYNIFTSGKASSRVLDIVPWEKI